MRHWLSEPVTWNLLVGGICAAAATTSSCKSLSEQQRDSLEMVVEIYEANAAILRFEPLGDRRTVFASRFPSERYVDDPAVTVSR